MISGIMFSGVSYADPTEDKSLFKDFSNDLTLGLEVQSADLSNSFAIDSSKVDWRLGSPTSRLDYNMEDATIFKISLDKRYGRNIFGASFYTLANWFMDSPDGSNKDYDWYSQDYANLNSNNSTLFSLTESELTDATAMGLELSHSFTIINTKKIELNFSHSVTLDHTMYLVGGATLLSDNYDEYDKDVGEELLSTDKKALQLDDYFLTYNLGLNGKYKFDKNIYLAGGFKYKPIGKYWAEDIHYQRDDLNKNPSGEMKSDDVDGYSAEIKLGYTVYGQNVNDDSKLDFYVKYFIDETTANSHDDGMQFNFVSGSSKVDLHEASRESKGIALGMNIFF